MNIPRSFFVCCAASLVPALAAMLVYWPAVHGGFVWDDRGLLLAMPVLRESADWLRSLSYGFVSTGNYFRPLPVLMLALEQTFAADGQFLAHLDAVLLHAANTALLGFLALQLALRRRPVPAQPAVGPMLGALIFGLHPAAVEAVAWASCRFELMCVFFCLLALTADLCVPGTWSRALSVGTAFFLAALSKETAVGLALLLPAWHRHCDTTTGTRRNHLHVYAAVLVAGLCYLALRHLFLGKVLDPVQPPFSPGTLQHLAVVLKSLGFYVHLLIWPLDSSNPLHPLKLPLGPGDLELITGALALVLTAFACARRSPAILLPLCALLALSPMLNLIPMPIGENYAHERFVYLPLVFISLWCALLLSGVAVRPDSAKVNRAALATAIALWLLVSIPAVRTGLHHWENDLNLWQWAYQKEPEAEAAQTNLLATLVQNNRPREALDFANALLDRSGGQINPRQLSSMLEAQAMLGEPSPDLLKALTDRLLDPASVAEGVDGLSLQLYANAARLNLRMGLLAEATALYELLLKSEAGQVEGNYGAAALAVLAGNEMAEQDYRLRWESKVHPLRLESLRRRFVLDVQQAKSHRPNPSPK